MLCEITDNRNVVMYDFDSDSEELWRRVAQRSCSYRRRNLPNKVRPLSGWVWIGWESSPRRTGPPNACSDMPQHSTRNRHCLRLGSVIMDDNSNAAQKKRGFGFRCVGADSLQVYLRISVVSVSCILKYCSRAGGIPFRSPPAKSGATILTSFLRAEPNSATS